MYINQTTHERGITFTARRKPGMFDDDQDTIAVITRDEGLGQPLYLSLSLSEAFQLHEELARELSGQVEEGSVSADDGELPELPDGFEVRELEDDEHPPGRTECGTCGRAWDDDIVTSLTPSPSGRCPFEYYRHGEDN